MKQPVIKLALLLICCQAVCVLPASFLLTLCHPVWIGLHAQVGSGAACGVTFTWSVLIHGNPGIGVSFIVLNMYNIQEGKKTPNSFCVCD